MTNGHGAARFARLGILGFTGVIAFVLLQWAILFWWALPNRLSGMNGGHAFVSWVATSVCALIIISAMLALIRQLRGYAARMRNAAG